MPDIREIAFNSTEYKTCLNARDLYLRKPIGLPLSVSDTNQDRRQIHYAAFEERDLVGGLIAKPLEHDRFQLRQIWVAPEYRRTGVASALLDFTLRDLTGKGAIGFMLEARIDATDLYSKLGFKAASAPYQHLGIEHIKMERTAT